MTTINQHGKPRDSQRGKLYKAERVAIATTPDRPLPTVKHIERYIRDTISGRATLVRRYGIAADFKLWPVEVGDGRGTRNALAYGTYKITIPLWARNEWVVLHEIAHIIHERIGFNARQYRRIEGDRVLELRGGAAHGWQYAAVYIDLVHFCMGAEYADALKDCFKHGKVRFREKRTRILPPGWQGVGKPVIPADQLAMQAVEGRKVA